MEEYFRQCKIANQLIICFCLWINKCFGIFFLSFISVQESFVMLPKLENIITDFFHTHTELRRKMDKKITFE